MDSSGNKLHTIGVTDNAGDVPASVRANTTNAQQEALNQLFGLNLPTTNNNQAGQLVATNIFNVVHGVYTSMNAADLQALIDQRVLAAVNAVQPAGPALLNNDLRRIHAVAQAVYESIPSDLLERFALASLPTAVTLNGEGLPSGIIQLSNVPTMGVNITINTDLPAWKVDSENITDAASIVRRITGRTPAQLGITGSPWANNVALNAAQAATIAGAAGIEIITKPLGVGTQEFIYNAATPPATFRVDVDKMMNESTNSDAPVGLQNRPIYSMTELQIRFLMNFSGRKGDYPYWKKYVKSGLSLPSDPIPAFAITGPFSGVPRTSGALAAAYVVRTSLNAVAGQPVGRRVATFEEVQRNLAQKIADNQILLGRLRGGSENIHGAIIAASLASRNPSILSTVNNSDTEAKTKKDLNDAQKKIQILDSLRKIREMQVSFSLSTLTVPAGSASIASNLAVLRTESADLQTDMGVVSNGSTPAAIQSHFGRSIGLTATPAGGVAAANRNSTLTQMQNYLGQMSNDIASFQKIDAALQLVRRDAVDADLYSKSSTLRRFITDSNGTINPAAFTADVKCVDLSEEIKKEMGIESDEDLKSTIEKAEAELKKLKAGGETGDVLQQKVFQEHFKNQGISPQEAQKSANYLYSRSLIDNELRGQINDLEEDIFEDHENTRSFKDRMVLASISREVGINPRRRSFSRITHYDWQTLSYPRLITAYYSLKKLYEGTGPTYLNSSGSSEYKAQMRSIARSLADRHVTMLINDFGNDLPDKDREKLQSRKTLSLELMEKMLTGDAPVKYIPRIDGILDRVDKRTNRYRRSVTGTAGFLGKNTISTSAYLGKSAANTAVSLKDSAWKHKKNIMACTAMTALGGPLGFAAWAAYKTWNAPNATAA